MLYISDSRKGGNEYCITDTSDNTKEWVPVNKIISTCRKTGLQIKGVHFDEYNNAIVQVHIIKVKPKVKYTGDLSVLMQELKSSISNFRKMHNPSSERKVQEVLNKFPNGVVFAFKYEYVGDGDKRLHHGSAELVKDDNGIYHFYDEDNTMNGRSGDVELASWVIDVCMCFSKGSISIV